MRRQGRAPEKGEGQRAGRVGGGKGEREEEGLRIRGRKRDEEKAFTQARSIMLKRKEYSEKGLFFI